MAFYTKYVVVESLVSELHEMDLSESERAHLSALIDSNLHHQIMDEILSSLSVDDKKLFIKLMEKDPESERLMEFLNGKVDNIEGRIQKVADELVSEMEKDVKEAKKIK